MEFTANLYFKHPVQEKHSQLVEMFDICDLNSRNRIEDVGERSRRVIELAEKLNPDTGIDLASNLLRHFDETQSFGSQSLDEHAGYCKSHWVNGSIGLELHELIICFLGRLCPDIHAQSYVSVGDIPAEAWYKYENGQAYSAFSEPYTIRDDNILGTIYRWWHSSMPDSVKEGYLNDREGYLEVCEDLHGELFLGKTEISDAYYMDWLTNSKEIYTIKDNEPEYNLFIPPPPSGVFDDKTTSIEPTQTSTIDSEVLEFKSKLTGKFYIQLFVFVVSACWLIWVFLIK